MLVSWIILIIAFAVCPSASTKTLLPASRYPRPVHLWRRDHDTGPHGGLSDHTDRPHEGLSAHDYMKQYHDAQAARDPASAKFKKLAKSCFGGLCGGKHPKKESSKPAQAEHAPQKPQQGGPKGQPPNSAATQSRTGTISHAGSSDANSRTKLLTSGSSVDRSGRSQQRKQQHDKHVAGLLHSKDAGPKHEPGQVSPSQDAKTPGASLGRQKGFRADSLSQQIHQFGRQHESIQQTGVLAQHVDRMGRQDHSIKSSSKHDSNDPFRKHPGEHEVPTPHTLKSPFEQGNANLHPQQPTKGSDQQRKKLNFISLMSPKRLPKGLSKGGKGKDKAKKSSDGEEKPSAHDPNREERLKQGRHGRHDVTYMDTLEKIEEEDAQTSRRPSFTAQRSHHSRQKSGSSTHSKETIGGSIAHSFRSRHGTHDQKSPTQSKETVKGSLAHSFRSHSSAQDPKSSKAKATLSAKHDRNPWFAFLKSKNNAPRSGQEGELDQLSKSSKHTDGTDSWIPKKVKAHSRTESEASTTRATKPFSFKAWGHAAKQPSSSPTSPSAHGSSLGHFTPDAHSKQAAHALQSENTGEAGSVRPAPPRHTISSGGSIRAINPPRLHWKPNVDKQFDRLQSQLKWRASKKQEEKGKLSADQHSQSHESPDSKSPFDFRNAEHHGNLMPFAAHKPVDPKFNRHSSNAKSDRDSRDVDKATPDSLFKKTKSNEPARDSRDADKSTLGSTDTHPSMSSDKSSMHSASTISRQESAGTGLSRQSSASTDVSPEHSAHEPSGATVGPPFHKPAAVVVDPKQWAAQTRSSTTQTS